MSGHKTVYQARGEVPANIPAERWYQNQHCAELDQALVEAIEIAELDGQSERARQLALQIRGLYFDSRGEQ